MEIKIEHFSVVDGRVYMTVLKKLTSGDEYKTVELPACAFTEVILNALSGSE